MLTDSDLKKIDGLVAKRIKQEVKPIKEDIAQIRKDVKVVVNFFDREYLDLRKRVERIEAHLKLSVS